MTLLAVVLTVALIAQGVVGASARRELERRLVDRGNDVADLVEELRAAEARVEALLRR